MKYTLCFLFVVISLNGFAQSATDRLAGYKYYGQYIQPPVRASHASHYNDELLGLKEDYTFHILFQIDTAGKIINLHSKHQPKVPQVVIDYAYALIKTTNGQWKPEVKNCRIVVSDTITCQFHVVKKKTFEDFDHMKLEFDPDYIIPVPEEQKNICWIGITYK